jgi:hypothetical protein
VRADSYVGITGLIRVCESILSDIKIKQVEEERLSLPPMIQPQAATKFTFREDFVQTKTTPVRGGRGGSRWGKSSIIPTPVVERVQSDQELGARWLIDPNNVVLVNNHMSQTQSTTSLSRAELRVRSKSDLSLVSLSTNIDNLRVFIHSGFDWEGTEFHLAGLLRRRRRKSLSAVSKESLVCLECSQVVCTMVSTSPKSTSSLETARDVTVSAGEVRVRDGVVGSVYQHVVSPWSGGTSVAHNGGQIHFTYSMAGAVRKAEVIVQPICLTIDQDTLEFFSRFIKQTTLLAYQTGDVIDFDNDSDDSETPPSESMDTERSTSSLSSDLARRSLGGDIHVAFQSIQISPIHVEINYRSKRLSMSRLRRGDPLQLLNLVPVLEGLTVNLSEIKMVDVVDKEDIVKRLIDSWGSDINKAQILRSISGVTPIRSLKNLSIGVNDLIQQPLKQIRKRDGHLSRGLLRGLSSFVRTLAIESLNLADVVVSSAQTALEFVDDKCSQSQPTGGEIECIWEEESSDEEASTAGQTPNEEWTAVERGARERTMDPQSAIDGLKSGRDALIRGVKTGITKASSSSGNGGGVVSMVKGAPSLILQPVIGATQAVSIVLRGARSAVDSGRKRADTERKFKAPYTHGDLTR